MMLLWRKRTKEWLPRPAALSSFRGNGNTSYVSTAAAATPAFRHSRHHNNVDDLDLLSLVKSLQLRRRRRRRIRHSTMFQRRSRQWGCLLTVTLTPWIIISTFHRVCATTLTPTNYAPVRVDRHQHHDHDHDEVRLIIENCLSSIGASMAEYYHHHHDHQRQQNDTIIDDGNQDGHQYRSRPFVTLAYAQSLDGKIALFQQEKKTIQSTPTLSSTSPPSIPPTVSSSSSNFALSGTSSRCLTHGLRSIHDAVLVGGRTLAIVNPRLDNRLWWTSTPTPSSHTSRTASIEQQQRQPPQSPLLQQPRPVVLDPHLNYVRELKESLRIVQKHDLIVCHRDDVDVMDVELLDGDSNNDIVSSFWDSVTFLPCKTTCQNIDDDDEYDGRHHHHLDLEDVLYQLYRHCGIRSVMVEGGAAVLSSFARAGLVDCMCVTTAPMVLGNEGLDAFVDLSRSEQRTGNKDEISSNDNSNCNDNHELVHLGPLRCFSLGPDCVILSDCKHKSRT